MITTHASDQAKAKQNLKEALMALNPNYKPLGFTIDSLASCSEGVLNDALKATQEAMTTILSTIGKYSIYLNIYGPHTTINISSWSRIFSLEINLPRDGNLL